MLVGKYEQNIDAKGRVNIPAKFRTALGDNFVVAFGAVFDENCVNVYPMEQWNAFMERVAQVDSEDRAMLMRYIQAHSAECTPDTQGRAVIPPDIRRDAGLTKEIVVVGEHTKAEIWSLEKWNEYSGKAFDMDKISGLMKNIGI